MAKAPSFAIALGLAMLPLLAHAQMREEEHQEQVQNASGEAVGKQTRDLERVAELIVQKTNAFRREQDREPVKVNPQLKETAQDFAYFMARTDKYGHTADGNWAAQRAKQHGYEYCIVLENITYAYRSTGFTEEGLAEKFTQGWIDSPGHRENMLDRDVTETNVAVAHSDQSGNYYAVQMFGRPRSQNIEFTVANESRGVIQFEIAGQVFPLPPRIRARINNAGRLP